MGEEPIIAKKVNHHAPAASKASNSVFFSSGFWVKNKNAKQMNSRCFPAWKPPSSMHRASVSTASIAAPPSGSEFSYYCFFLKKTIVMIQKEPLRTFWGALLKLARLSARPKIIATPFPHYEKTALRGKKWRVFVLFARTKTAKSQRFKNK